MNDQQTYEELATQLHGLIRTSSIEYIICAAIHFEDGKKHEHQPKNIESGFVVAGRRHHNCFMTVVDCRGGDVDKELRNFKEEEQGFLTSKDRFVNRKEGGEIAYAAGQTADLRKCLFSEDLY